MRNPSSPAPSFPICCPSRGGYSSLLHRASRPHGLQENPVFPAPIPLEARQLGETELPGDFLCSRMQGAWLQAPAQIIRPINRHSPFSGLENACHPDLQRGSPCAASCTFLPSFLSPLRKPLDPHPPAVLCSPSPVAHAQPRPGARTSSESGGGEESLPRARGCGQRVFESPCLLSVSGLGGFEFPKPLQSPLRAAGRIC